MPAPNPPGVESLRAVAHAVRESYATRVLYFLSCAMLLFCSGLHAQENCNVEVKLLLSPTETQAATRALGSKQGSVGRVYFFDTKALDLLSQGVIVRLRQGARGDLTVKLRPPNGKRFFLSSEKHNDFKCEVDLTGEGPNPSYSITSSFAAERLPQTGDDVSRLMSSEQMMLLQEAKVSVDWANVTRIAEIRSTDWRTQSQPHLGKLTLELWDWGGGQVLEISTRVSTGAGSSTYTELQQLVERKHLAMNPVQRSKTSIALEAIMHAAAQ